MNSPKDSPEPRPGSASDVPLSRLRFPDLSHEGADSKIKSLMGFNSL